VIATDVGGVSEAVEDGRTGLLVGPRDPEGLAAAMVEVLGDLDRARSMGAAGRRKVETEFSQKACADAVLELYDELLSEKGSRP
jgi:glycosyltransferase involved in cell wall biosynthesis